MQERVRERDERSGEDGAEREREKKAVNVIKVIKVAI